MRIKTLVLLLLTLPATSACAVLTPISACEMFEDGSGCDCTACLRAPFELIFRSAQAQPQVVYEIPRARGQPMRAMAY